MSRTDNSRCASLVYLLGFGNGFESIDSGSESSRFTSLMCVTENVCIIINRRQPLHPLHSKPTAAASPP